MATSFSTTGTLNYFFQFSPTRALIFHVLFQLVPCTALVALLPLVPDSPRWLLMQNRNQEGLEAIRRYLGKGLTIDDPLVQSEYHSITGAILIERESEISFTHVLARRDRSGHLKRLLLGCGGQFMQVCGPRFNFRKISA
jgi:hypothetical protein